MVAMAVRNEYVFDFSEFHAHYQRTIISVGREIHEHIVVYQYLTARSVNFTLAQNMAGIPSDALQPKTVIFIVICLPLLSDVFYFPMSSDIFAPFSFRGDFYQPIKTFCRF